jgi:hypothetical protein
LPGVHIAKVRILPLTTLFCFCRWREARLVRREESDVRFALRAPARFLCVFFVCGGVAAAARLARARSAGKTAGPLRRPRGGLRLRPAPSEALARSPTLSWATCSPPRQALSHTHSLPPPPGLPAQLRRARGGPPRAARSGLRTVRGSGLCDRHPSRSCAGQGRRAEAGASSARDSKSKRAFCARPDARPSLRGHVPLAHLAPRLSRTSVCFSQRPPRKQASAPCSVRAGWLALLRPGAQAMPPRP